MKFEIVNDGQWHRPVMKNHKLACCDCGLVHTMNYRIVGNKIEFKAERDEKLTRSLRRRKQYKNQKL